MKQTILSLAVCMTLSGVAFASTTQAQATSIEHSSSQQTVDQTDVVSSRMIPQQQMANVHEVDFKRNKDGGGQLILSFDRPLASADVKRDGHDVLVNIDNAQFPHHLLSSLHVADYGTPVRTIEVANNEPNQNGQAQSHVRIVTNGDVKFPSVFQSGTKVIVEIDPLTSSTLLSGATVVQAASVIASNNIASNDLNNGAVHKGATPSNHAPVFTPPADPYAGYGHQGQAQQGQRLRPQVVRSNLSPQVKRSPSANVVSYVGKPVTFNFQDVPVRTVLQLIADESQINIVAADNVSGNVTIKLDAVPWDQALDTILRAKGLDKRRQGSVLWVAPQNEIADYEQAKEDARIALDNRADLTTEYIQINYHNAAAIYKALTEAKGIGGGATDTNSGASETGFLSPRGRLVVDERTNMIMISDIPRKIEQLKELIAVVDRPVDQVLIEARVVVATESYARELGARFGVNAVGSNGRNFLGATIEDNIASQSGTLSRTPMSNTGVVGALGSGALSFLRGGFALDLELSAMQDEGKGEIVSNPRIVTTNQREAVISQGKEVGYVTIANSQGSIPTPNVEFKEVLLEMKVTPTITNDGRVFLDMNVKKDEVESMLRTAIGDVPQISKRQINTAVLVEDGQTVVVGGVYEFTDATSIAKVPFLGDIPFLGNLFKKRGKMKDKAELLIFMTPKILRVAQPEETIQAVQRLLPRQGEK